VIAAVPVPLAIHEIELCSGERRHWQYLGAGAGGQGVWRDLEDGREFGEQTLMYAWRILDRVDGAAGGGDEANPR